MPAALSRCTTRRSICDEARRIMMPPLIYAMPYYFRYYADIFRHFQPIAAIDIDAFFISLFSDFHSFFAIIAISPTPLPMSRLFFSLAAQRA